MHRDRIPIEQAGEVGESRVTHRSIWSDEVGRLIARFLDWYYVEDGGGILRLSMFLTRSCGGGEPVNYDTLKSI